MSRAVAGTSAQKEKLIAERLVVSQGKDSSVPRYSFPPERGPAIQRCEVNKYRPLPTMPLKRKKKTKNKKKKYSGLFL